MSALIITVFIASLVGSLHCAGMCGAFVAIATGSAAGNWRRQLAAHAAYHGGRLMTYALLGAAAGTAGKLVDVASTLAGIKPIAAAIAGATMIAFGIFTLLRLAGVRLAHLHPPAFLAKLVQRGHRYAIGYSPVVRALLIGLLMTLLPCGWLYAFAVTAAGTASTALGALTMAAFWLGTLPVLAALGAGVQRLMGAMGRKIPAIASIALVVIGLYTLTGRLHMSPVSMAKEVRSPLAADSHSATQPAKPPCCAR